MPVQPAQSRVTSGMPITMIRTAGWARVPGSRRRRPLGHPRVLRRHDPGQRHGLPLRGGGAEAIPPAHAERLQRPVPEPQALIRTERQHRSTPSAEPNTIKRGPGLHPDRDGRRIPARPGDAQRTRASPSRHGPGGKRRFHRRLPRMFLLGLSSALQRRARALPRRGSAQRLLPRLTRRHPSATPGYGPNTRTLLQFRVKSLAGAKDPSISLPAQFTSHRPVHLGPEAGVPTPIPKSVRSATCNILSASGT